MRATRMALHTQWRVWSESLWALMRASYTPRVEHCELIWCNIAQLASGMTVKPLCRLFRICSVELSNGLLREGIAISQSFAFGMTEFGKGWRLVHIYTGMPIGVVGFQEVGKKINILITRAEIDTVWYNNDILYAAQGYSVGYCC